MNHTQMFKFPRIWIYSENRKLIRLPLGRINAQPSCTVARGPCPQHWLGPCAQRTWPMACQACLGLREPRLCGAARERSPRSGRTSWRGRRRCYHGGGGAREGAQAPTVERPPAGHVDGGGSSPELLADGKGGNRISGDVLRWGEGSGGRRQSCVRVEGERKLGSIVVGKKVARGGGVLGLRSPWGFRDGGGALGQGHGARTATWSALGTGGGAVRTARMRRGEARRGDIGSAAAFSDTSGQKWPVGTAFNLPGAFGHRRPWQPIRARREVTLPLTAGPHSSVFFILKINPGWK
jgi:hypothetical protein